MRFQVQDLIARPVSLSAEAQRIAACIEEGRLEELKAIMTKEAFKMRFGSYQETPLEWATNRGKEQAALLLIELGASPFDSSREGRTPFELAANLKELSLFKQMASHLTFPRHKIAFEQFLIRFLASSYGIPQKKEEVLSYLEQGFFKYGDISLAKVFFHLLKGDAPESLFAHFFQEIDVTWKNEKEQTALDLAARYGRGEIALRLLEMGALANTDRDNRSSLFQAVIGNQAALILPLLEKGAAIDQMGHSPDYPGQETALHLAARRRFFPCLKALLSAEARRDLSGIEGRTPFLEAVISGHLPSIELLSRGFPSSQMQDIAGNNALHLALLHSGKFRWAETKELLSFLRHLNVDARACNLTGQSPLQLASSLNAPIEVLNILKIKK